MFRVHIKILLVMGASRLAKVGRLFETDKLTTIDVCDHDSWCRDFARLYM